MTTLRRAITPALRARVFVANGGRCHICGQKIEAGARWDVEHVVALADGGGDDETNMAPAHTLECHKPKSAKEARVRAHVVRIAAAHIRHQKARQERRRAPNAKQRAMERARENFRERYDVVVERVE